MVNLILNGKEYTLATNLRVAYNVQNQHNHKSYMEIFQTIDSMSLEDQIGILYEAAKVGSESVPSKQDFLTEYLDAPETNVSEMMGILKQIFEGILGKKIQIDEEGDSGE